MSVYPNKVTPDMLAPPAQPSRTAGIRKMSRARFESLVEQALDSLPAEIIVHMDNVVVLIEDWPTADQQGSSTEPLFGLYEGISLPDRDDGYIGATPDVITIFREPIMEACLSEAELKREIKVTVIHEVGHHFGIDDERLDQLGWG